MSEYWVSKKQYFCQYCKIFIRDDAPSRRQHETGLRHQGNKDRFLRDIYKTGEKAVKEKAEEKKIMAQIDRQAALAHGSSGYPSVSSSSSAAIAPKPRLAAGKPATTDKYANYSTAADLGFVDADSLLSDLAKLERDERAKVGQAGTWETVAVIAPGDEISGEDGGGGCEPDARYAFNAGEDSKHHLGLLRGSLDDDPSEEARSFRFETDRAPGDDAERPRRVKVDVYDDGEWNPDSILGLAKKKKEKDAADGVKDGASDVKLRAEESAGSSSDIIKGEQVKWQRGDVEKKVVPGATREVGEVASPTLAEAVKVEDTAGDGDADREVKVEETAQESKPSTGSMFKKRKAPGAANRSVRQKM